MAFSSSGIAECGGQISRAESLIQGGEEASILETQTHGVH